MLRASKYFPNFCTPPLQLLQSIRFYAVFIAVTRWFLKCYRVHDRGASKDLKCECRLSWCFFQVHLDLALSNHVEPRTHDSWKVVCHAFQTFVRLQNKRLSGVDTKMWALLGSQGANSDSVSIKWFDTGSTCVAHPNLTGLPIYNSTQSVKPRRGLFFLMDRKTHATQVMNDATLAQGRTGPCPER